jgi:hypothetical protein
MLHDKNNFYSLYSIRIPLFYYFKEHRFIFAPIRERRNSVKVSISGFEPSTSRVTVSIHDNPALSEGDALRDTFQNGKIQSENFHPGI